MTGKAKFILLLLAVGTVSVLLFAKSNTACSVVAEGIQSQEAQLADRLKLKADSAKAYCKQKGFNTDYCFLVDFKLHSGKQRFFVWDLKGDSIKHSSLCAHGYGKNSTVRKPVFSNVEGSYCSSFTE